MERSPGHLGRRLGRFLELRDRWAGDVCWRFTSRLVVVRGVRGGKGLQRVMSGVRRDPQVAPIFQQSPEVEELGTSQRFAWRPRALRLQGAQWYEEGAFSPVKYKAETMTDVSRWTPRRLSCRILAPSRCRIACSQGSGLTA